MMISCLFVCVCLTESWWPEQIDIQSWSLRAEDFSGKTLSDFKTETVKETVKKKESHRRAEVRDRFDMKEKWYSSEKRAFSCGQEHNSLTLCWREPGCETRATAKRERQTQGGRVAGSERKWWARQTICWVCARLIENWWWEKWRAAVWGGGGRLCCWADANVVSGDQNKELIKDARAAHWERGHSLLQMHYARSSIE